MAASRLWLRSKPILIPLLLATLTALAIWLFYTWKPAPPEIAAQERSWPVRTTTLEAQRLSPQLRLLGRVETPFRSTLTSSVTANVAAIPVLEGQAVNAGQVILELERTEVELLLAQRQADVDELLAQKKTEQNQYQADQKFLEREKALVAIAEQSLARVRRLEESNLTSQASVDEARQVLQTAELSLISRELAVANHNSRIESLDARLQRARALLEQARLDLESTEVKAPFTGVITAINVSPGERVRGGETLLNLYDNSRLEVRAQIPMRWVAEARQSLAEGTALNAEAPIGDTRHPLVLNRLSGRINPDAGGVDALFSFAEATPDVTLNRTLDVRLNLAATADTFSIPVSALYDAATVYRVRDGRLEPVEVTLAGDRFEEGQQRLLVRSPDLESGDRILVTQLPNALRGLKVDVIEQEPDA
ncbi:MAG: biotin/lipoyl-binding protein [Oleiphilaceae bacterium]|nr:biotin/lipoyl-binding protein [Oleiphilaceae bacterium]